MSIASLTLSLSASRAIPTTAITASRNSSISPYQLGTGKIKSKREKEAIYRYADSPDEFYSHWFTTGFRERVLNWLDAYTDYAMTLDLPLWASKKFKPDSTSPLRNLSVDQLIAISVDNLRYFQENRARSYGGAGTKFLNVIQDAEHGTGQLWYDAVIYTFHATALDACDLVFGDRPDFSKVPMVLQDFVKFVADFFQSDRSGELLLKNESVLKTLDPDPKPKKKT